MPRMTTTAALAALIAVCAPAALAADPNTTAATTTVRGTISATQMQPGQMRGTDLRGADIYDRQDNKIASVKDIIIGRDGRVEHVVLDVAGKNVAVGMQDLTIAMTDKAKPRITMDMSEEQLKSAQAFDLDKKAGSGGSMPPGNANR